ncbi:MAG: TonB-dependent receptor [Lentimicrobiaceae bacterium]|jgi:iron complex outermembrane receptor protein
MFRRVVVSLLCLCFVLEISAQTSDSVYSIRGVEIKADRISLFSAGLKIEKIDSITRSIRQGISIAALLSEQSPVFLRSYSPGGIASLSLRGTNSSQSGVFWNGINLNQPNLGMTDLSRISVFEFSAISIQPGGASALLGSGVIGGSLHLSNTMNFSTPLHSSALLSVSGIGGTATALKLSAGSSKLAYSGSMSGDWNQNNFYFTDFTGNRKRLEHALAKSVSTIHQAEYILNKKQRLTAGFWYQATDRQIPPTMTMSSSDQRQWDQAIRSSLQWSYTGNKQSFILRTAFIDEKEYFESKNALIDALYHVNTFQTDFEYKRSLGKQITLGSGTTGHLIRADIPTYNGIELQPEGSIWLAFSYIQPKSGIKSVLNLRQDFSKGYKVPFCPSLGSEIPISKQISASFGASRNFRVPTMNDRFWIPGGNPDLLPESSWNLQAGMVYESKQGKYIQSRITVDFYSLFIDNLIQWVPGDAGIWSAQNVQKVWSRGIEITSKTDFQMFGFKGYFRFGYNYTPSTFREITAGDSSVLNKQLIYIPLHKVVETFYAGKGAYYAMFAYSLTGQRFVQSDNSKSLPAYSILDFYTGAAFKTRILNFRLQAEIHNIFNKTYQSILYYPEPGRYYSVNLLISK